MTTPITYTHKKHFSYDEAVSALVLVKPIVGDIISKSERILSMREQLKFEQSEELEMAIKILIRELEHHLEELDQVGCLLKDPHKGLIDFPSVYNGEEVYLCWQYGENTVSEYHSLHDGFDARMPIPFEMI